MIGIVVSRADEASSHIGEHLLDLLEWEQMGEGVYARDGFELREFDELHLDLDNVAEEFGDIDYVVVASKHSGDTGPLLSAHFTGNFGVAEYGGADRELSVPTPNALSAVLGSLSAAAPSTYDVSMECTHHGPTDLGAPGMFVELGSGPEQWSDPDGARAVAKAILELDGVPPFSDRIVVAFGGNHYAPRPTRIIGETEFAVGHVAADWSLSELGSGSVHEDLIEEMFETSRATCAVIDGELPEVRETIASLGYRIVSETWIRETSGFDPDLVEELEVALGSVEDGLRFGGQDPGTDPFLVVDLPQALVDECQGIDLERTLGAVSEHTIAYQSAENGNRVGASAAVTGQATYDRLIDSLTEVLESAYDIVRQMDDTIVTERETFDPELAAAMGVPEGPKFGRLAAGESVTVDGETIEAAEVRSTEIRRFEV